MLTPRAAIEAGLLALLYCVAALAALALVA